MPVINVRVNGPFSCLSMVNCYETEKGGVVYFGETLYQIWADSSKIWVQGVEPIVEQEAVARLQAVCRKMQLVGKALVYCEPVEMESGEVADHCVCVSEFGVGHYVVYSG